jgi:hypothetical protein
MKKSVAMLGKIAGFLLLQKTVSTSTSLAKNLLASMAAIIVLALIATLLLGFLILGGIYIGHQSLLAFGYSEQAAALITSGGILCLLVIILLLLAHYVQKIRDIPGRLVINEAPVVNVVSYIADAFVEGFRRPRAE